MVVAFAGAVLLAGPAVAGAAEPVHVARTVTTASGAQLAAQTLRDFRNIEIGSGAATLTVEVDGTPIPIPVTYADVLKGGGEGTGGLNLVGLALWGAVGSMFFRAVRVLSRLGRRV